MTTNFAFASALPSSFSSLESLTADQLGDVSGCFSWREMGRAALQDGVKGAIGGGVAGLASGAVTLGTTSIPGWVAGTALGFVGGAAAGAVGNAGSQLGVW